MTKKPNPIEQDKEPDLIMCREHLVELIKSIAVDASASALKVKVEAIKSLGRFHHALQVDKTTIKANAQAAAFTKQELVIPQLKPEHKERLANLLDAKSS